MRETQQQTLVALLAGKPLCHERITRPHKQQGAIVKLYSALLVIDFLMTLTQNTNQVLRKLYLVFNTGLPGLIEGDVSLVKSLWLKIIGDLIYLFCCNIWS